MSTQLTPILSPSVGLAIAAALALTACNREEPKSEPVATANASAEISWARAASSATVSRTSWPRCPRLRLGGGGAAGAASSPGGGVSIGPTVSVIVAGWGPRGGVGSGCGRQSQRLFRRVGPVAWLLSALRGAKYMVT